MKHDRQLAEAHVTWYMSRLRQVIEACLCVGEDLLIDNFEHGVKHGRELEQKERVGDTTSPDPKN